MIERFMRGDPARSVHCFCGDALWVDAGILRAICFIESRYRINAVSPKGARGPMQFMPDTAARYGFVIHTIRSRR